MSIKNQSFEDFEVIVVNDGSTDSSLSVVEDVIFGDSRFKVINQLNGGLSVARNAGVKNATGEYITFLDSDDKFSDDALNLASKICTKNDLDMLVYGADVFFEENVSSLQKFSYERPSHLMHKIITGRNFFEVSVSEKKYSPSACMYWIKNSLAKRHEFFPGITHEDNLYTTQVLLDIKCQALQLIGDAVYLRRVREGSIMMTEPSPKNYWGYLKVYQMLESESVVLAKCEVTKKALDEFRVSLFESFVRTIVLVHRNRMPLAMRLEIWKCWGGARGCLCSVKSLLLTIFPVLFTHAKKIISAIK